LSCRFRFVVIASAWSIRRLSLAGRWLAGLVGPAGPIRIGLLSHLFHAQSVDQQIPGGRFPGGFRFTQDSIQSLGTGSWRFGLFDFERCFFGLSAIGKQLASRFLFLVVDRFERFEVQNIVDAELAIRRV
jgi:hypothetical protein